ncbi:PucR family transcriptional regulator [Streptomyces sp. NPDC093589]|uniref:PucR family transcriptional regulator n=1 Tax=Streptomyces sp. NPDC093589 TaxID=3366043 RepID=UPI0037F54A7D
MNLSDPPKTGEELFALADAMAAVIGGSVAIEDLEHRVVAYSTLPGQRIDELRRRGILERRVPDLHEQEAQYRRVLTAPGVVRLPGLAEDELPRAAAAVLAGDMPLGTVWAIENEAPLDEAGERALLDGARTAALHMLRRRSAAALELHAREQSLRAALDGAADAEETAYRLGLPPGTPLTLLGYAPAADHPDPAPLLARAGAALGRHWAALRPAASVATGPRATYVLLSGETPAALLRLAEQSLAAVSRPPAAALYAAISRPAVDAAELPGLRAEVDDVLRVITADPDAPPVAALADVHARVLLAHLADDLARHPRLRHPGIDAMLAHDRDRGTHYAASVTAWLDAVGNVGEAARQLTVHQNTLKYRLRRARELFGLDLKHPDDRLSCWMQLRLRHTAP